jgi:hypothetical protein
VKVIRTGLMVFALFALGLSCWVFALGLSCWVLYASHEDQRVIRQWAKARGHEVDTIEDTGETGPYQRDRLLTRIYKVRMMDRRGEKLDTDLYPESDTYWLKFAPFEEPRAVLKPPICRCPMPDWIEVEKPGTP